MIFRIACLTVPAFVVAGLVACTASLPEGSLTGADEVKEAKGGSSSKPVGDGGAVTTPTTGKTGTAAPASASDAGGKNATAPSKKGPEADPTCVETCERSVMAKCDGDQAFCEDLCVESSAAFMSCLAAAAGCTKADWFACENPDPAAVITKGEKK